MVNNHFNYLSIQKSRFFTTLSVALIFLRYDIVGTYHRESVKFEGYFKICVCHCQYSTYILLHFLQFSLKKLSKYVFRKKHTLKIPFLGWGLNILYFFNSRRESELRFVHQNVRQELF